MNSFDHDRLFPALASAPAFRDESFLAEEIEYALAEKRSKGDRFAIIMLVFSDPDGRTGTVPDVLKRFIWKTPSSPIEALRELVRALPVAVGPVSWRHT